MTPNLNKSLSDTILLKNIDDINKLVEYFKSFNLLSEQEIIEKIGWFIGHYDNKLYIHSYSCFMNHSYNNNIITYIDNGYICHKSIKEIQKNQELFLNYKNYNFPDFYLEWCKKNNLKINDFL